MARILLSICIPVYNNGELFRISLTEACESIIFSMEKDVEIVVSDNASDIQLWQIVYECREKFPSIPIIYNRNKENIGMSRNFLKVVEWSRGDFCWIIGSDDFIMRDSVHKIVQIIHNFPETDFINCGIIHVNLNQIDNRNIDGYISSLNNSSERDQESICLKKFKDIINLKAGNVFLGSIMTGIFRRKIWNCVDKSEILSYDGFDTLASIYPHCYIYATGFMDRYAIEYKHPLIVVGDGKRPWTTDNGNNYWNSSLPLIYYTILTDMLLRYKRFGLTSSVFNESINYTSRFAGRLFLPILFRFFIKKTQVETFNSFKFSELTRFYLKYPNFYIGIVLSIIKPNGDLWRLK
ncbi:MAG: hypothetical protein CVV48_04640 [Spirochaetae bacterium HGW-Spirochaetae-4]|nr:MAG: hypothetical protein CVV48_04640 [Spirochaetae bacterium HGW-Spirochaetae-4]